MKGIARQVQPIEVGSTDFSKMRLFQDIQTVDYGDKQLKNFLIQDNFDWCKSIPENNLNPTVFHGTSKLMLDSILVHGLDPEHNPLRKEDFDYVHQLRLRVDPRSVDRESTGTPRAARFREARSSGLAFRQNSISVSCALDVASRYALAGPEKVGYFLRDIDSLRNVHGKKLQRTEVSRLGEIQKYYSALLEEHEPMIVAVQPKGMLYPILTTGPFADILHKPELYKRLVDYASGRVSLEPGAKE
ncbi:MAG: hypothetical protein KDD62_15685, partial [Bdellovibrionales bacterium]|nr:hypothetical protein [Bdellovibrionales bacterium]